MQGSVERLDPWLVCFAHVFRVEQFASRRALVVCLRREMSPRLPASASDGHHHEMLTSAADPNGQAIGGARSGGE